MKPLILLLLASFLCFKPACLQAAQETQNISIDKLETRLKNHEQAQKKINSLLDEREAHLLYLQSRFNWRLEDEEQAKKSYEGLLFHYNQILTDPYSTQQEQKQTLKQLVKLNLNYSKYEEAFNDCLKLQHKYPTDKSILELLAEVYHLKANSYIKLSDYDCAINQYESILSLPNLSPNWYAFSKDYLAYLYILKGEDDKALSYYQSIIGDHPDLINWSASAHFSLGQYYIRKKSTPKAKEQLQTIIKNYPTSSWAKPAQDTLRSLK